MSNGDNTLEDFPPEAFAILAFCDACGHSAPLDRARVPQDLSVQALRHRLRCAACGSRETSLRIAYAGAGGFHYATTSPTPR